MRSSRRRSGRRSTRETADAGPAAALAPRGHARRRRSRHHRRSLALPGRGWLIGRGKPTGRTREARYDVTQGSRRSGSGQLPWWFGVPFVIGGLVAAAIGVVLLMDELRFGREGVSVGGGVVETVYW